MADLSFDEAKSTPNDDLLAVQVSGQNPDGTQWGGMKTQGAVPTGGATVAEQETQTARLAAIETATEAIETRLANQATLAVQNDQLSALNSLAAEDFATQTTLAAVLAKIIAAPATEATLALQATQTQMGTHFSGLYSRQDTANTSLGVLEGQTVKLISTNAGTATGAAQTIVSLDVGEASFISYQISGTFNMTQIWECSNDNTNWVACPMASLNAPGNAATSQQPGSKTGIYTVQTNFRYWRARVSAWSSGTLNATVLLFGVAGSVSTQAVTGNVTTKGQYITGSAPATSSVGVADQALVSQNFSRKGLILTNTHATQRVSLAFGATAVLDSGITIMPGQQWKMDEYSYSNSAIRAIASGAATVVSIQEFT